MFFQIMIHLIPSSCLKQMQWNALRPSMVCTMYKGTLDCALTWQTAKYHQAFHFLPFFPMGRGRESVKKREELTCWYKIYLLTLKKEEITVMMCIYICIYTQNEWHTTQLLTEHRMMPSQTSSTGCLSANPPSFIVPHDVMSDGVTLWPVLVSCAGSVPSWLLVLPIALTSRTVGKEDKLKRPWLCTILLSNN